MPWVRLDDGFADHPKLERAGPLAAWLHVAALCYCARHLTDGRIPKAKARRLSDVPSPAKHIGALLDAGLWHEDGDDYVIHDYLDYQPSRADTAKDREAARERMANARRNKPRSSPEHPPNVPANNGRSSDNPVPSRPKGNENERDVPSPDPEPDVPPADDLASRRFEEHFWPVYPRRNGKRLGRAKALVQWLKLTVDQQRAAVRGAKHYAAHCETTSTYAKDPERWLRDRCWDDWLEPAPIPASRPEPPPGWVEWDPATCLPNGGAVTATAEELGLTGTVGGGPP